MREVPLHRGCVKVHLNRGELYANTTPLHETPCILELLEIKDTHHPGDLRQGWS